VCFGLLCKRNGLARGYGKMGKTQQIDKQLVTEISHAHVYNEIKKKLTIIFKKWINNDIQRINGAGS